MRCKRLALLTVGLLFAILSKSQNDLKLWYKSPAKVWEDALPVGNGRLGAMVFGDTEKERIQFNENTLYSGRADMLDDPTKIYPKLDVVRGLMKKGKLKEAEAIIQKEWNGRLTEAYQPFGDVYINFLMAGEATDYTHSLDMGTAIVTTQYKQAGANITREVFASYPSQTIAIRISANKPILDFDLSLSSLHPISQKSDASSLTIEGKAPAHVQRRTVDYLKEIGTQKWHPEYFDKEGNVLRTSQILYGDDLDGTGTAFAAAIVPLEYDGEVTVKDNALQVRKASSIYMVLTANTGYNGYNAELLKAEQVAQKTKVQARELSSKTYQTLKKEHIADHKQLFDRVEFNLPSSAQQLALPTNERLDQWRQTGDLSMITQFFNFGRYLMIAGSRGMGQPLNLQGLWNDKIIPPWNSAYTMNINLEMNYWPAEVTNLSECHAPLFRFMEQLADAGRVKAKEAYQLDGWVAHHNTSLWREAHLSDANVYWRLWNVAGAWLCDHIAEHYAFTKDKAFLETYYPIMKGASTFFSSWLVENDKGYLVTPVSTSPENSFKTKNGIVAAICEGPTVDIAIIKALFMNTIALSSELGVDKDFAKKLSAQVDKLAPYQIGSKGQLLEWDKEYIEVEPQHRHVSHLFGVYPGREITPTNNPELCDAVRKTLDARGNKTTGWSMAWKVSLWARLLDANNSYDALQNLLVLIDGSTHRENSGGVYRNLLNALPFQIDGNFGATAGIAEMLLQSHENVIHLLPAIPQEWTEGKISGLKARGGFTVDMEWKNGQLYKASVTSPITQRYKVRYGDKIKEYDFEKGEALEISL